MSLAYQSQENKWFIPMNTQLFGEEDDLPVDEPEEELDDDLTDDDLDVEEDTKKDDDDYLDLGDKNPVYNGETRKVKKSEAKDLLQMGMNYGKVHGKLSEYEQKINKLQELAGMDIDAALESLEQQKHAREVQQYAYDNSLTEEEAQRELAKDRRLQALENEVKVTKLLSNLEKEKAPFKEKLYFKELEPEIDQLVKDNALQGREISVEAAFNFLRGKNLDELMAKATTTAVKSTVAQVHDRARRGPTSSDGSHGDDVDTTDIDVSMARAFGNDPKSIAKYVKKAKK